MVKKLKTLDLLKLPSTNGIYCVYPFSKLDNRGKGCFKIGVTATSFNDHFNQFFTCLPMGIYYVNFLCNPVNERNGRENGAYYADIETKISAWLTEEGANQVTSRTGVTGTSEWWYTDTKTIAKVFRKAKKRFGGRCEPFDLDDAFKYNEPTRKDSYFIGEIRYY